MILRLPSIAGTLVAAWLLFRITEQIAGAGSGFLAVAPFVCAGAIVETAADARPYALGLATILLSFLSLREWVHTNTRRWLIIYYGCSSLILYFHYLFGVVFLVQAVYLAAARRRLTIAPAVIAIAALPLIPEMMAVMHAPALKTAEVPSFGTLFRFYPLQVFLPVALGFGLFRLFTPSGSDVSAGFPPRIWFCCWRGCCWGPCSCSRPRELPGGLCSSPDI